MTGSSQVDSHNTEQDYNATTAKHQSATSTVTPSSFTITEGDEPHAARRRLILKRYPRVRALLDGHSPHIRWQVLAAVGLQLSGALYGRELSWPLLLLMAWTVGGWGAHVLWSAIHECSHNQAFGAGRPLANQMLAIAANLTLVVPHAVQFRRYHLLHHQHLGERPLDADLPSHTEARLVGNSTTRKLVYVLLQPLFYYTRPLFTNPLRPGWLEAFNMIVQLLFNWLVVKLLGWPALGYLLASFLLSMGMHPLAAHFLSDHVIFSDLTATRRQNNNNNSGDHTSDTSESAGVQETYSYYGCLNQLVNNQGYHSEHHDFPSMASSKLPELRRLARGVYDKLDCHTSWVLTLWRFITDPRVSLHSRVSRPLKQQ